MDLRPIFGDRRVSQLACHVKLLENLNLFLLRKSGQPEPARSVVGGNEGTVGVIVVEEEEEGPSLGPMAQPLQSVPVEIGGGFSRTLRAWGKAHRVAQEPEE